MNDEGLMTALIVVACIIITYLCGFFMYTCSPEGRAMDAAIVAVEKSGCAQITKVPDDVIEGGFIVRNCDEQGN